MSGACNVPEQVIGVGVYYDDNELQSLLGRKFSPNFDFQGCLFFTIELAFDLLFCTVFRISALTSFKCTRG